MFHGMSVPTGAAQIDVTVLMPDFVAAKYVNIMKLACHDIIQYHTFENVNKIILNCKKQ